MMESRLDAMRRFWWQSSGSVDLDHAVLAPPRNDLCRCSISGLQKQCTTPCPRSSEAGEVLSRNTSPCATWSLTSPRADRISGPHKSCSSARKRLFQQYLPTADSYLF